MTTLNDRQADYIVDLLAPEEIRRAALSCIVSGTTPELLRTRLVAVAGVLADVWLAWADEIETLNAHGVAGQSARDAAKIALVLGRATEDYRRPEAYRDLPVMRRRVLLIADEMDALIAEGFDAVVYAKEIDQACGGAR
ncbi:MAG TPA: hypothetical protein VHZ03_38305 [Trebonia sp.]|nr:hypothetical protein [Trebonia sp.]